jgi:GxxExxY protein
MNRQGYGEDELNRQGRQERQEDQESQTAGELNRQGRQERQEDQESRTAGELNRQGRQERQEDQESQTAGDLNRQGRQGGQESQTAGELNRQGRQERQVAGPENPDKQRTEPDADTDRLAQEVIGAAIEVHRALGPGFLESLYEQAMSIELGLRGISLQRQILVAVSYKGHSIGESRLDLLVDGKLIVELKAVDQFAPIHTAQVMSYLKATGHRLGLLINFNVVRLKDGVKRVVLS